MISGPDSDATRETRTATAWAFGVAALVIAGIVLGSRFGRDFDPALVSYAGASVFAAAGLGYRFSMWLQRPPTRLYWRRGWQYLLAPRHLPANLLRLLVLFWDNFVAQKFIERRSRMRWTAHWLIAWGCLLAAAVTFPLSWGWIRFETPHDSQAYYHAFVFGVRVLSFPLDSPLAPLVFNILDIAAAMVIVGVVLALLRRATDRGAMAVQQFVNDFVPLILLFSISLTGVLLTISTHFLHGEHYTFLSQYHAVTVILTLMYLPFGKFFHVFQRPAQFGVRYYKDEGARRGPATCARCGGEFGTVLHVQDLKQVEGTLGVRYGLAEGGHYQDVCPSCRRKEVALAQDAAWRAAGKGSAPGAAAGGV